MNGEISMSIKRMTARIVSAIMAFIMMLSVIQFGMIGFVANAETETVKYYYEVIDDNTPVRAGTTQNDKALAHYNKGKILHTYAVVLNTSTNHKWVKIHLTNSSTGETINGYVYSEHCEKRGDVTSTDNKLIEVTKDPTAKYWDRPYDNTSYNKNATSAGTYKKGQVLKVSQTIKNTKGHTWYKVYNESKFIYSENVKNHGCACSASPIKTTYNYKDSKTHTAVYYYRDCNLNSTCPNYSKTYTDTKVLNHKFTGGICDNCKYEYVLTISSASRKYRITDTSGAPVYSRPYKYNSEKYGPIAYGTTISIDAKTLNQEENTWFRISSGTYAGKWIWDDHLTRVYTITYNANGGNNAPAATEFLSGNTAKITSAVPTKSGYTFKGWATSSSSTTVSYKAGNTYSTKASITLYAVWEKNSTTTSYTITYNANGGTVSKSSESVTAGKSITLPTPTRNYTITYNANSGSGVPSQQTVKATCKGWATSSTATTASYSCGTAYTPKASTTLYAVWDKSSATLSTTKPTRSGYKFLGWSTSSTATSATYSSGSSISLTSNVTLYAVWGGIFSGEAHFTDDGKDGDVEVSFNSAWFSSDSINYNHNIARLASQFAMLGYSKKDGSQLKTALELIGFTVDLNYIKLNTGRDQQNYFIASKDITSGGKNYTLIFAGLIGSNGKQWYSDFDPWGKGREKTYAKNDDKNYTHLGFADSREFVYEALTNYINDKKPTKEIKILLTGHSRGAAGANLLGAKLIKEGTIAGKTVSKSNIYTYTFATPNVTRLPEKSGSQFNRIFNFVNPEDFVTKVLPAEWNFGRYGKTFTLPSKTNSIDIYYKHHYLNDMQKFYNKFRYDKSKVYDYKPYSEGEEPVYNIVQKLISSVANLDEFYGKEMGPFWMLNPMSPYEFFKEALCPFVAGDDTRNAFNTVENVIIEDPKGKSLYGSVIYYFVRRQVISEEFAQAHEAQTYCAFLMSLSESEATKSRSSYKNTVNCPVDIDIYDKSSGELVGRIKNNIVDKTVAAKDNSIVMSVDGDSKQFWLPSDGNYDVKLIGNDKGTMDYTVAKVDSDLGETNRANFFDVGITNGLTMNGAISSGSFSTDSYTLKKADGTTIKPAQITGSVKDVKITTYASGKGFVTNTMTVKSGDYTTISAEPEKNNSFVGWYSNGKLVCSTKDYSFVAKENISLTAKFEEQSMSVKISCSDLNYKDTYRIKPNITAKEGVKYTVDFKSSDSSVASVSKNGDVYASGRGYAKITCIVTDQYGNKVEDSCNIEVSFTLGQWLIWILLFGFLWY